MFDPRWSLVAFREIWAAQMQPQPLPLQLQPELGHAMIRMMGMQPIRKRIIFYNKLLLSQLSSGYKV